MFLLADIPDWIYITVFTNPKVIFVLEHVKHHAKANIFMSLGLGNLCMISFMKKPKSETSAQRLFCSSRHRGNVHRAEWHRPAPFLKIPSASQQLEPPQL